MRIVAVLDVYGGCGATTVAAHLAQALHQQRRPVFAFDFCPENVLRLHFGMAWEDGSGFAPRMLEGSAWHEAAFRSSSGLAFIPFGALPDGRALDALGALLETRPGWLRADIDALEFPAPPVLVCDCPRGPAALRSQILEEADLVLLVCRPDPVAYAAATRIARDAAQNGGPPTMIVLNGFDPARRLDRDISALLRTGHRELLSPVAVHRDESIREALACKQTVFEFAPDSQAAYDFDTLATWTIARLGRGTATS
ncbi:cellulose synthase operon protein YhjQ [Noviherbaspirillum humi]|uniref:Cellulose synthase operon protein YhjQ n=1 Tax=Noviherbaspirillum humi TaxID=1688639 RepID=A0A239HME4_9BURK|nr:cellulose biosynthesis protein BcsQ [Noviherbaspirillum humi]SNS82291.1 cellulose synthase operon protein YhjQ [Noviherbaspirillum humi]